MNKPHASEPTCDLAGRVSTLTALLLAHGLAATAARAQSLDADLSPFGAADGEPVKLPEYAVEGERSAAPASPKFTVPVRDIPQTITVIPQSVMEEQAATSLRDVLRNTPGITFRAGEGGNAPGDNLFIRGFEARGDIFVDGVRDNGLYSRDTFNIDRIEVAKGPSSSVNGRGSTGGTINLVTKTPQATAFSTAALALGTDEYARGTLDLNQPLRSDGDDALRLNAMWMDAAVPGRDVTERKSWGIAPSLALGLGKLARATASYQHLEQNNIPDYGLPAAAATTPEIAWSNFYGLEQRDYEDIESDVATVQLEVKPAAGFTLRNLTRYGSNRRDSVVTAPRLAQAPYATTPPTIARRNDVKYQDRSDEMLANLTNLTARFVTGSLQHSLAAGLEFSREKSLSYGRTRTPASADPVDMQQPTDLFHPTPGDTPTDSAARNGSSNEGIGRTTALYAFDTVSLSERWQVTGSLRWDNFDASYRSVAADGTAAGFDRTDRMLSWQAGLVWKPAANGNVYLGAATSFNPSADGNQGIVLSDGSTSVNNANLEPEKNRSVELGTKWDLAGERLAVTAAVFRTEKTNARTRSASDEPYVLAGKQRVDGVELGLSGRVTDAWAVFGGYAHMNGTVVDSLATAENDHELQYTPEDSFNLWTTYQLTPAFSLGAGAQYSGRYYYSNTATPDSIPPETSYWLWSATAAWTANEHLTLRLNVTNLADERYVERGYAAHFTPGAARQAILTANLRF